MDYITKMLPSLCKCVRHPRCVFVCHSRLHYQKHIVRSCTTTAGTTESKPQVRVRFAPSPTGQLHLGGLRTALYNFLFARAHGGRFLLRMEDTDQTRLVPGATAKLIEMLQWSGIEIDEGPGFGGDVGPYTQSNRIDVYWENIQPLLRSGAVYYCFCSPRRLDLLRKTSLRRGEVPKYDNRCRHLTSEETAAKLKTNTPYVIRLKLEPCTEPLQDMVFGPVTQDVASLEGDPVMLKTDRFPTYHYANVVDDHLMGISHILRGVEWLPSTTKHILLYKAFGWTPPKFAHLPLLLNKDGSKLSKRQNDIHVQYFKDSGYYPDSVLNLLTSAGSGFTVSDTAGMTLDQLIKSFDISLLKSNSTKLELDRIEEFNRRHLLARVSGTGRRQVVTQVRELAQQRLAQRYETESEWHHLIEDDYIERVLDHCQTRITRLDDLFDDKLAFLWFVPGPHSLGRTLTEVATVDVASRILSSAVRFLETREAAECQDVKALSSALRNMMKQHGTGMKTGMTVLRLALAGLKEGPAVGEILSILGKESSLHRLRQSSQRLYTTQTETIKSTSGAA